MKLRNFNWIPGLFLLGYHLALLIAVPLYLMDHLPSLGLIITSSALMYITGLSVTAGYHRLYSHTTYKINPVAEAVLLFFGTMATQGSAIRWSFDHRHHHAFIDTDRDPYSIKKGFWYAHFMWLFEKPKEIENRVVSDLVRKPMLNFQHKYYGLLMVLTNAIAIVALGWYFNDYVGAIVFGWLARMFFLHHFTWFINSLAHTWGKRTYCEELSAVDNYMIALLTFGEGYHNYHHTFAHDYRNGIRWFHFDPTKWLIWGMSKLGLAHSLKKNHSYFIEEKLLLDRKRLLVEKINSTLGEYKDSWEEKITLMTDKVLVHLKELKTTSELYRVMKDKKQETKETLKPVYAQIKEIKKGLKKEWGQWMEFSRQVMALTPTATNSDNGLTDTQPSN